MARRARVTQLLLMGQAAGLNLASGGTAGMTADLRREAAGGSSVATTAQPVEDGSGVEP